MLNRNSEPVIMDFGLVRRIADSTDASLTQGMIVGTAGYMAPEQTAGHAAVIDQRCDLYAVGVMLFELLTGDWPFTGSSIEIMGRKCILDPPSPLSLDPELNPALATACHKLIAKRQEDRFRTCAEVVATLEAIDYRTPAKRETPRQTSGVSAPRNRIKSIAETPKSLKGSVVEGNLPLSRRQKVTGPFTRMWSQWSRQSSVCAAEVGILFVALVAMVITLFLPGKPPAQPLATPAPQPVVVPDLIESPLVTVPIGPAVDLIDLVDFSRDSFAGEWVKQGKSLVGDRTSRLYLPAMVPRDYQLSFTVTRTAGNGMFQVGFLVDGRQGVAIFDGERSQFSGLFLDGTPPKENCTSRPGPLFVNDRASTIVLTVHPGHVHATVDGRTLIDWYGEANRLIVPTDHGIPNRETPFIGVGQERFRVDSAELRPIAPETVSPRMSRRNSVLDLIKVLDLKLDQHSGDWLIAGDHLNSPKSGNSKYALPATVPQEYTLSARVELPPDVNEKPILVFGLMAGESRCSIVLINDDCLGLEKIDGLRWFENETRVPGRFFTPGQPVDVQCTVTRNSIRFELDGRTWIDWTGDFHRLSAPTDWILPDARCLFIGAVSHFKLSDIKLGPPVDRPSKPAHPPWATGQPVNVLPLVDPVRCPGRNLERRRIRSSRDG